MPDAITPEERAMIDAAVAAGKVTTCAARQSSAEYVWCEKRNQIITVAAKNGEAPPRRSPRYGRPKSASVKARRQSMIEKARAGWSVRQIAAYFGMGENYVYAEFKRAGVRYAEIAGAGV